MQQECSLRARAKTGRAAISARCPGGASRRGASMASARNERNREPGEEETGDITWASAAFICAVNPGLGEQSRVPQARAVILRNGEKSAVSPRGQGAQKVGVYNHGVHDKDPVQKMKTHGESVHGARARNQVSRKICP